MFCKRCIAAHWKLARKPKISFFLMKKFRNCRKRLLNRSTPMTWQKKYLFCQKCHVSQKFGLFQTNHSFNQKKNWDLYQFALDTTRWIACIVLIFRARTFKANALTENVVLAKDLWQYFLSLEINPLTENFAPFCFILVAVCLGG